MIITVTANPSLDRTLLVRALAPGQVHRARRALVEPSGKGVNVALALKATGNPVRAVLPVGGATGRALVAGLDRYGLVHVDVPIAGDIRSNVSIVDADGTTTKVNEPGPVLSAAEVHGLVAAADGEPGDWVAWCGSLPGGFDPPALADAVAKAVARGVRVAVDTSGETLATVLNQAPYRLPQVLKPNLDELAAVTGRGIATLADAAEAASGLVRRGVDCVLLSLGADGALLVRRDAVLHGLAPVPTVQNTAGAGDALLAGFLAAGDVAPADRLAVALRFGAAAVQHEGTVIERVDMHQTVHIQQIDAGRALRDGRV